MSKCLWCGKEVNKYKDSICKECAELVEKGKFNMTKYLKRPSVVDRLNQEVNHGSK